MISLEENLCAITRHPELLVFSLFKTAPNIPQSVFRSDGIAPIRLVKAFNLEDGFGVLRGNILDIYGIELSSMPDNLEIYLNNTLNKLEDSGAIFSFFMFDFVFDFFSFLTESAVPQIYGIKVSDETAQLALSNELRGSNHWKETIRQARERLLLQEYIQEIL